jgi:hypothetical protein
VLVSGRYNDGGFSGGTLERPALKRIQMGRDNQRQLTVDGSDRHKLGILASSQELSESPPSPAGSRRLGVRMDRLFMWMLRHAKKAGATERNQLLKALVEAAQADGTETDCARGGDPPKGPAPGPGNGFESCLRGAVSERAGRWLSNIRGSDPSSSQQPKVNDAHAVRTRRTKTQMGQLVATVEASERNLLSMTASSGAGR